MSRVILSMLLLLMGLPVLAGGPEQAAKIAAADMRINVAYEDRRNARYFWRRQLIDEKTKKQLKEDAAEEGKFYVALKYAVNKTSRELAFVDPIPVGPGVWRVDLADLAWDRRVLERAKDVDVYFRDKKINVRTMRKKMKGKTRKKSVKGLYTSTAVPPWVGDDFDYLVKQTRSEMPIFHAEWFVFTTTRQLSLQNRETGLGYYDMLGLKDRNDFFKLVGLDEAAAIKRKQEVRAALSESLITGQKGRQIVFLDERVWQTLDTDNPTGRSLPIANLRRGEFKHKAEEIFGRLPNGLPAMFLCDNNGKRQATAPDFVGHNTSKLWTEENKAIHAGQCMSCHTTVILPIGKMGLDWVRETYYDPRDPRKPKIKLASGNKAVHRELINQYMNDLAERVEDSQRYFARKIQLATATTKHTPKGLTPLQAATYDSEVIHNYAVRKVTLQIAAAEWGVTPSALKSALIARRATLFGVDPRLAPLLHEPSQPITRTVFEDAYRAGHYYLKGSQPP